MIEASTGALETVKMQTEGFKETIEPKELNDLPTSLHETSSNHSDADEKPGKIYIICRNESFEGEKHPITGVEFIRKDVEIAAGNVGEGVFPVFESAFDAQLDESQYLQSDVHQFREASSQLKEEIESNPDLCEDFTSEQLEQIELGDTPDGYIWHHSEEAGTLQLVDTTVHAQTGHTGGRFIWGGGSDYR